MTKPSSAILKESSLALNGSDYVRDKLLALTSIGPRSLYEQVYAIKVRVKSLESLAGKVALKRIEGRKDYSARNVTDIVGMRLLCLYAEDLPRATKSLISFLRFCQYPEIKLIEGESLDDGIHEIRIYKSANTSRIYDTIFRDCLKLNLQEKNEKGEKKISLIEAKSGESTYSSIHFVIFCLSHSSGEPKRVPLEVQVRTVFEDTWGEIDHSLKYKGALPQNGKIPPRIVPFHDQNKKLLEQLKTFLEESGNLAESIRGGYQAIFDQLSRSKKFDGEPFVLTDAYRSAPSQIDKKTRDSIPPEVSKELDDLLVEIDVIRNQIDQPLLSVRDAKVSLQLMEELQHRFETFRETIGANRSAPPPELVGIYYIIGMEIGILCIWRSKVSRHFSINPLDADIDLLKSAQNEYITLEQINHLRADPVLNFRLGLIMHEIGLPEHSDFFLYRAFDNLGEDESISTTIMPSVIANFLSFSIWLKRARLHLLAISSGDPRINSSDQRAIVAEAFFYCLVSLRTIPLNTFDPTASNRMRLNVSNNTICYLWELRDLSRDEFEFQELIEEVLLEVSDWISVHFPVLKPSKLPFSEMAEDVRKAHESEEHKRRFSDTLMKFSHLDGDVAKLKLVNLAAKH